MVLCVCYQVLSYNRERLPPKRGLVLRHSTPRKRGVLDKVQDPLVDRANTVLVCVYTSSLCQGSVGRPQALGVYHTYSGVWIEE